MPPDIETRIHRAFAPTDLEPDMLERIWSETTALAERASVSPRTRRVVPRAVLATILLVAALGTVALAQESVRQALGIDRHRPAEQMQVFTTPADATFDELEGEHVIRMFGKQAFAGDRYGTPDLDQIHEVLDFRHGDFHTKLYLLPTDTQKACLYAATYVGGRMRMGSASCDGGVRFNGFVSVTSSFNIRDGFTVYGLATDRVKAVRIRLPGGQVREATMGENAWLWHGSTRQRQARGIDVVLRNGTVVEVAMNGCLRKHLAPPLKSRLGCGFGMNREPDQVGSTPAR